MKIAARNCFSTPTQNLAIRRVVGASLEKDGLSNDGMLVKTLVLEFAPVEGPASISPFKAAAVLPTKYMRIWQPFQYISERTRICPPLVTWERMLALLVIHSSEKLKFSATISAPRILSREIDTDTDCD